MLELKNLLTLLPFLHDALEFMIQTLQLHLGFRRKIFAPTGVETIDVGQP